MGCPTYRIKYLQLLFNVLCALLGIATIVVNAVTLKDMGHNGRTILCVFIALGAAAFLASFIGCFGAIKENICLTWAYAITMLVLATTTVVLLYIFRMHIEAPSNARDELRIAWKEQMKGVDAMAEYQQKFHCCGIKESKEYTDSRLVMPVSCFDDDAKPYTVGCLKEIENSNKDLWQAPKLLVWILMVIEIASFTFATILGLTLRNEKRRNEY